MDLGSIIPNDLGSDEVRKRQEKMETKIQHIWSILSAFEESSAASISDLLTKMAEKDYNIGILMAEKFVMHVEILFAAIGRINKGLEKHNGLQPSCNLLI